MRLQQLVTLMKLVGIPYEQVVAVGVRQEREIAQLERDLNVARGLILEGVEVIREARSLVASQRDRIAELEQVNSERFDEIVDRERQILTQAQSIQNLLNDKAVLQGVVQEGCTGCARQAELDAAIPLGSATLLGAGAFVPEIPAPGQSDLQLAPEAIDEALANDAGFTGDAPGNRFDDSELAPINSVTPPVAILKDWHAAPASRGCY
jgi:hypothetical protein